ncbi:DUF1287 domain-containing protein [uncultured Croceitalea sp.]|uniref:DUF1287 domain-containing protein n=1 Tax=uncultured Croceitalea sp. TaxID=1798908 RepID=UPI00330608FF
MFTKHSGIIVFLVWSITLQAQQEFFGQLADSAATLTKDNVTYDPAYFSMSYPNGDVPKDKGVCTDVVIRAYRKLGIDLQKEVHEDMVRNFDAYPKNWGLQHTDKNIDHRRVPNLMTFFDRFGAILPMTKVSENYSAGDIVCWSLGGGLTHIGLVTKLKNAQGTRPLIIHNIGSGQVLQDCLFDYKIIGHYRYGPQY